MAKYNTLLYYCYSTIENGEQFAADHLNFCKELDLTGRIIVADEGLNGTVSGTPEACQAYMDAVLADERFAKTDFKVDEVDEPSFVKMHVRYKSEIVHSGLRDPNIINPNERTGVHLEPKEFMEMKDRDDVVVLDVMLPDGDGFDLCAQLHRRSNLPVILLTARDTSADRVRGLDLGADDYVTKPFEPRELVARINSVLRRRGVQPQSETASTDNEPAVAMLRYDFAGLSFMTATDMLVRADSTQVQLSTAESRLLNVFLKHPSVTLDRQRLMDLTARPGNEVFDRAIDRQISRLRRKLADDPLQPQLLRTVWGGGYMLAADVSVQPL